jgi:stalled ribosome rescue protein Dom34
VIVSSIADGWGGCVLQGIAINRYSCSVVVVTGEDLWHSYNLIREGDILTATTFRKVTRETGNSVETERIKVKLSLEIESVDFDPEGGFLHASLSCMPSPLISVLQNGK